MVEIVKKYETGTVVECVHCNGTGVCTHSSETREKIPGWDRENHTKSCNRCGKGITAMYYSDGLFCRGSYAVAPPKPPTCAVCGGVGSVRI